MKAEDFIDKWLNKKYAGAKEVGDWTHFEVVQLLKDFQKQIWEDAQTVAFETENLDTDLFEDLVLVDDLKEILEADSNV